MEFMCEACGSPAVEYPAVLRDDAPMRCRRCKEIICTLDEFRRSVRDLTGPWRARSKAQVDVREGLLESDGRGH
jgi:hypothetical protein